MRRMLIVECFIKMEGFPFLRFISKYFFICGIFLSELTPYSSLPKMSDYMTCLPSAYLIFFIAVFWLIRRSCRWSTFLWGCWRWVVFRWDRVLGMIRWLNLSIWGLLYHVIRSCWKRRAGVALGIFLWMVERNDLNPDWGDQQLIQIIHIDWLWGSW